QHCRNVQSNHPRTEASIDRFLSLPLEDIIRIFRTEVHQLASLSSSSSAPTLVATSSGPTQMTAEDLLKLSPIQICSLMPSVAPKSILMDLYLKLSPEQMDAMPSFITPLTGEEPVIP